LTNETVSGDELRPRDRPGKKTLPMTVEAGCILANGERAAAIGTGLERQMEDKWIVSKGKSYSSVEEHAVKARPRLACSSLKERRSLLAMCLRRRADSLHPNLAVPRRS